MKRKWAQPQAQIELLDNKVDNSSNKTASANLHGTEGTDTELSDAEND
jgi:hypothetical protein